LRARARARDITFIYWISAILDVIKICTTKLADRFKTTTSPNESRQENKKPSRRYF